MTHNYYGLTAWQVAENRNYFGANSLSNAPVEYDTTQTTRNNLSLPSLCEVC